MPIVPALCPNCGGQLEVDNAQQAAVCKFCGSPFIVEKAINNYTTVNNTVNNITADTVNVINQKKDFEIWEGVLEKYIGEYLTAIIPDGVSEIDKRAFAESKVKRVIIPEGVKKIKKEAFLFCKDLSEIILPTSLNYIDYNAFKECGFLKNVYITDIAAWCKIKFDSIDSNPLSQGNLYLNGDPVTNLIIPDSVTSISDEAFCYCYSITNIVIGNNVTSIGNHAFGGCHALTGISIGSSVTSIGNFAFSNCKSLKNIIMSNSVISIGECAFSGCQSITSITLPNSITSIGRKAFEGCKGLTSITIPDSVTSIGDYAFSGCTELKSVELPNNLKNIEGNLFLNTPLEQQFRKKGLCKHCGGQFKGLFTKICTRCGRKKDY